MDINKQKKYYIEKCNCNTMLSHPFFFEKLKQIEILSKKIKPKYYKLSRIVWPNNINHIITHNKTYPSEYFIKTILNTAIINNEIINIPIELSSSNINLLNYVPLYYNKLLIMDALFKQGSKPRYSSRSESVTNQGSSKDTDNFLYSEHTGTLHLDGGIIDNIIIHTNTNRLDPNDKTILLPNNSEDLLNYEFLFHTHPNSTQYAGRINEGIIYEFPSANDIMNFIKYHVEGKAQASIIIAPEGIYVIRLINFEKDIIYGKRFYYDLKKFLAELEYMAISNLEMIANKLSDPNIFHKKVGMNFEYINYYNNYIKPSNLYIEYYPREKKNNEWCLRSINLAYIEL